MNNKQLEFLDEVYKNYNELFDSYYPPFSAPYPKRLTREEVFSKCKGDPGFAEEYGLKIEERVLSLKERKKLANYNSIFISPMTVESWDRNNIPTKLITVTYKDKTIESYE